MIATIITIIKLITASPKPTAKAEPKPSAEYTEGITAPWINDPNIGMQTIMLIANGSSKFINHLLTIADCPTIIASQPVPKINLPTSIIL